jgi:hypothetical protein
LREEPDKNGMLSKRRRFIPVKTGQWNGKATFRMLKGCKHPTLPWLFCLRNSGFLFHLPFDF